MEAGGQLLDPAGGPWEIMSRRVLAANATLGPAVAALLAACPTSEEEPQPLP
jgi:inositol-phosphate phosphatase / L-galactose 1-phosphate phosphatase